VGDGSVWLGVDCKCIVELLIGNGAAAVGVDALENCLDVLIFERRCKFS
jgi:hypothetical protein